MQRRVYRRRARLQSGKDILLVDRERAVKTEANDGDAQSRECRNRWNKQSSGKLDEMKGRCEEGSEGGR